MRGFLLIELLVAIATAMVILTILFYSLDGVMKLQTATESRVNLSQNTIVAMQIVSKQLALNTRVATIEDGYLKTKDVAGNKEVSFARQVNENGIGILYIVTKNANDLPGVNQLSDPNNVDVASLDIMVIRDDLLKITITLRDLKTSRQEEYSEYVRMYNGKVR